MQARRVRAGRQKTAKAAPASPRSAWWQSPWLVTAIVIGVAAIVGFYDWPSRAPESRAALDTAEKGQFVEAEPALLQLHERHPGDIAVVRALGVGYLGARRYDEAEVYLNRWQELQPREVEPLQRRIELWMLEQKTARAAEDVQGLLKLRPNDQRGRQILAQLFLIDAHSEEAEREAVQCLQDQPTNQENLYLLASIYQQEGRPEKAVELIERLLRLNPNSGPAMSLRARLLTDAGQLEPAIKLLSAAVANPSLDLTFGSYPIDGRWANVLRYLTVVQDRILNLHSDGQPFPRTQVLAEQALDRSIILFQLSQALARAGRDQEAKRVVAEMQWPRALALWSADKQRDINPALQGEVVDAYVAAGKVDDAVAFLSDILRRQPNTPGTRLLLADCYDKQGQTERAAEQRRLSGRGQ